MRRELRKPRKIVGRVPRLASRRPDVTKLPTDNVLRQAMAEIEDEFRGALSVLQTMHRAGREEAGIFLLGLLAHSSDDWKRRVEIVHRLEGFNTRGCADFLFDELKRVKGNNITRGYLAVILDVLAAMPRELVQTGLLTMIADAGFSRRMRDRLTEALHKATGG